MGKNSKQYSMTKLDIIINAHNITRDWKELYGNIYKNVTPTIYKQLHTIIILYTNTYTKYSQRLIKKIRQY